MQELWPKPDQFMRDTQVVNLILYTGYRGYSQLGVTLNFVGLHKHLFIFNEKIHEKEIKQGIREQGNGVLSIR